MAQWTKTCTFWNDVKRGEKMSTRKGKVVLLEEVLNEAITFAKGNIEEKNTTLAAKDELLAK